MDRNARSLTPHSRRCRSCSTARHRSPLSGIAAPGTLSTVPAMPSTPPPPAHAPSDGSPPRRRVWLTIKNVLDELDVDRGTFDHWRRRGAGPRMKRLPNGTYRIRGDWFDTWLDDLPDDGWFRRGTADSNQDPS